MIIKYSRLFDDVVAYDVDSVVPAAYIGSRHQVIRSTGYASPFKQDVIGWFPVAVIDAF